MRARKKYMFFIQGLVILFIFSFILFYNLNRSRVMVLHSYSNQIPEVAAFNEGFSDITKDLKNPYIVNSYMNIALATSPEERMKFGLRSREFIKEFDPEIIVAVGEEAQEYVLRHNIDDLKAKIVFACIRPHSSHQYDQKANATGVLEEIPVQAIKEVLANTYKIQVDSGLPINLIFVGDKSFRVNKEKSYILQQNWDPFLVPNFIQVDTFDDWRREIIDLHKKKDTAVIFLLGYDHLTIRKDSVVKVPSREVLEWTLQYSPYPVIGLYENHFYDGAPLSLSPSARESGEKAANYVKRLMCGDGMKDLPILTTNQFMVGLRKGIGKKESFAIPKSFEVIAQTNKRYVEE